MSSYWFQNVVNHKKRMQVVLSLLVLVMVIFAVPGHSQAATLHITNANQQSGTKPFDANDNHGNDSSGSNLIVRTLDTVTYGWSYSVNGGDEENVTMTSTLPVGMEWVALPAGARTVGVTPASSISADKRTITVNVGHVDHGSAFTIYPQARILGGVPNGGTLVSAVQIVAPSSTAVVSNTVTYTVSAAPQVDLRKNQRTSASSVSFTPNVNDQNGNPGVVCLYRITAEVDGGVGNEPLAVPFSFTDQLSGAANYRLYNWGGTSGTGINGSGYTMTDTPYGKVGVVAGATTTRSVVDSGTWSATQTAAGQPIAVTVSGTASTVGSQVPTQNAGGSSISATVRYLLSGWVAIWISNSDIQAAGGTANIVNTLTNFTAVGATSGRTNVDSNVTDNTFSHQLTVNGGTAPPTTAALTFGKSFTSNTSGSALGGNGYTVPGQTFYARVNANNSGTVNLTNLMMGDKVDNTTMTVTDITAGTAAQVVVTGNVGGTVVPSNFVIEYGTGNYADWTAQRSATLGDADSVWYTDTRLVPGGNAAITKVRIKGNLPATANIDLYVKLTAKDNPSGTILPNFAAYRADQMNSGNWNIGTYNPTTNSGTFGARQVITSVIARIGKTSNVTSVLAGDNVIYTLSPTLNTYTAPAVGTHDLTITDTLPKEFSYVDGSASLSPTSVAVNGDGTTTIVWTLPGKTANVIIPVITFQAKAALTVVNGTSSNNLAVISTPLDSSPISSRTAQRSSVIVQNVSGFRIFKTTPQAIVGPDNNITYTLSYTNLGATPITSVDLIDIFPFNGDGRSPATTYSGVLQLNSISVGSGETIQYTKAPLASLSADPNDPSNQAGGSTNWSASFLGGVYPANASEVTAVRIKSSTSMAAGVTRNVTLVLNAQANAATNTYSNRFSGRAAEFPLLVTSNAVSVSVAIDLSGSIFNNPNGNTTKDVGEAAYSGVTVRLRDSGDTTTLATTTTNSSGLYRFSNLSPGTYLVKVDATTLPASISPNYDYDGVGTSHTAVVTLLAGQAKENIDFGYVATATISAKVWLDSNGNGSQGVGEPSLGGVTVVLKDSGGNVVATTATSSNGNYTFSNIIPGKYTVSVDATTLPASLGTLSQTHDLDGIATPHVASVTLVPGDYRSDVDFGYRGTGKIGDLIWNDANGNNLKEASEVGLANVSVDLTWTGIDGVFGTADDMTSSTVSAADGSYQFSNLTAGQYRVTVNEVTLPTGLLAVSGSHQRSMTLLSGQNNTDVDFGYQGTGGVSGAVWQDTLATGTSTRNAADISLSGITVKLLDNNKNVLATTTTAADGSYSFSNRAAGSYFISIDTDAPVFLHLNPSYDYDGLLVGSANLAQVTIGGGQTITKVDFTYKGTGSLAGFVRQDPDGSGDASDPGDPGISAVTVTLLDSASRVIAVVTTGSNGSYSFGNLLADNYTVTTTNPPSGLIGSYSPSGSISGGTTISAVIGLAAGQAKTNQNFGYKGTGSISASVWYDIPGNGATTQGTNPGIGNVTLVALLDSNGNVIATTTTDASGHYSFNNLANGTYTVSINPATLPGGLIPSYDSNGISTPNTISNIAVNGTTVTDANFSYKGTGAIGDLVWNDRDGSGTQNNGEPGLANVTVNLTWAGFDGVFGNGDDRPYTAQVTNVNGNYNFTGLVAGNYKVTVDTATAPTGMVLVSGANPRNITLAAGEVNENVHFGFQGTNTISGKVLNDVDADGTTKNDTPKSGIIVTLLDDSRNIIATTTTATDGSYSFPHRPAGTYHVDIDSNNIAFNGQVPSYDYDGLGIAGSSFDTAVVTVSGNTTTTQVDFGYKGTATLTGSVLKDTNGDGVKNDGATGIGGVTVTLTDVNNLHPQTTTTAADGTYNFTNLLNNTTYHISITTTSGPLQTLGLLPAYDPDSSMSGLGNTATIVVGTTPAPYDFGYKGAGSISSSVWYDVAGTGDGTQGSNPGIGNVTLVALLDSDGNVIATTTTDSNGHYSFNNLPNGTYTISINPTTLPGGLTPSYDKDGVVTPNKVNVVISNSTPVTDANFSYKGTGAIGDLVWNDRDGNGTQNNGEPGLATVSVNLRWAGFDGTFGTSDDKVYTAQNTNVNGNYNFTGLVAGNYRVSVVTTTAPAGMTLVSGSNPLEVALSAGEVKSDVHFGFRGTGGISGVIWKDGGYTGTTGTSNKNTLDTALSGVIVTLFDSANDIIATTTTAADGSYNFASRPNGTYVVKVTADGSVFNGMVPSYDQDGVGTANSVGNIVIDAIHQSVSNIHFSYKGTATIAGYVKLDPDGSGDGSDPGDPPLSGITVTLKDASGNIVATVTTGADGSYRFGNLLNGNYTITTSADASLKGSFDPTGKINNGGNQINTTIVIAAGESKANQTFGYKGIGGLSGVISQDSNANGTKDAGEPGIANVTLTALDGNGAIIKSVSTDANGAYSFTDLTGGQIVTINVGGLPVGLSWSYGPEADVNAPKVSDKAKVSLAISETKTNVNFGYNYTGRISGFVWEDRDANAVQEGSEPFLNGVKVILKDSNGVEVASVVTVNGSYSFGNLPPGNYTVTVDTTTVPVGMILASGTNPLALVVGSGQIRDNQNFGFRGTVTVSGLVLKDINANNMKDAADVGISGVIVNLLDANNSMIATATTGADGKYSFPNVSAGGYKINIDKSTLPAELDVPSYDPDGVLPYADGTSSQHIASVTVTTAATMQSYDFGYLGQNALYLTKTVNVKEASIGDILFYKVTALSKTDVVLDKVIIEDLIPPGFKYVAGSAKIDGVKVDPIGNRPIQFADLIFKARQERVITYALTVGSGVQEGDCVNSVYGIKASVHISNTATAKVAIVQDPIFDQSTIIGKVFHDRNGNGIQEAGEEGIAGAKVATVRGEIITTDRFGRFHLAGVDAGRVDRGINFIMKLDLRSIPAGAVMTTENPRVIRITRGLLEKINFGIWFPEDPDYHQ